PRYLGIQRMKSMKLYVGNLPSNTSAKDLEDLFTPYGAVISARILTTKHSGPPRGYGYVEMLRQHAELAMAELHGQRINFMVLSVTEAKS
ncbi:MAG: RNA-binding protein, partial [Kiloniellales bacterium]|nr:RNA-binding protein [Kiloniellales bacterium]